MENNKNKCPHENNKDFIKFCNYCDEKSNCNAYENMFEDMEYD